LFLLKLIHTMEFPRSIIRSFYFTGGGGVQQARATAAAEQAVGELSAIASAHTRDT
jgi:hypothetical protein